MLTGPDSDVVPAFISSGSFCNALKGVLLVVPVAVQLFPSMKVSIPLRSRSFEFSVYVRSQSLPKSNDVVPIPSASSAELSSTR